MKNQHSKAVIALFISTILWGSAGVVVKLSLSTLGPYYLLAMRFVLAAVLLLLIFIKRLRNIAPKTWKLGGVMGILLYFEFLFFTVGLSYTTASKAAFLIGAYVILVPIAYIFVNHRLPAKSSIVAAFVCMIGVALVLLDDFNSINIGDLIVALSSACYALHVVLTARFVKKEDPININIVQITTAALAAAIVAPCMETFPQALSSGTYLSILYLAVAATISPYLLSVYGQKYTKTTTAAVILSFECVVGCIAAVLVLGDSLTARIIFGASIMVLSFLITEIRLPRLKSK